MAIQYVNELVGTFTATGQSDAIKIDGRGLVLLDFGTGSVTVQGSIDGTVWLPMNLPDGTTAATFTGDHIYSVDIPGSLFIRLDCTSYTASIGYRIKNFGWWET